MDFLKKLQELMNRYPNLKVYSAVEPDVVADPEEPGRYLGFLGPVEVMEYICDDDTGKITYKDYADSDFICEQMEAQEVDDPDDLYWDRAIFVNVGV